MTDYTYNTGNAIGSTDVRDGVDNLKSFDVMMNSQDDTYQDRLGNTVPTAAGAIKRLGPVVVSWTFTTGGTLNYPNEAALNPVDGNYYGWTGAFPKAVAPGTDPTLPGSGYAPRTDVVLRGELAEADSQVLIAGVPAETLGFLMKTVVLVTESRFTSGADIASGLVSSVPTIQAAIDYVSSVGGGIVDCNIAGARYLIDAGLVLRKGVWLRGLNTPVIDYQYRDMAPRLLVTVGKGSELVPAIRQNQGSYISGFSVEYPDQVDSQMRDPHTLVVQSEPYKYGWFITLNNADYGTSNIDAPCAGNLLLVNPYNGIKYFRTGKYNLHDIYGQPIRRGLWVDGVLDVSRQSNVHWWTYHSVNGTPLYNWIHQNAEAYILGRADNVTSISLFAYGYNVGRRFCNLEYGGAWWGSFHGCLMDICKRPLVIESMNKVDDYGCGATTGSYSDPCIVTASGALTVPGVFSMHGGAIDGGSNIGALISSDDGTYIFDHVNFSDKTSSGIKGSPVVVESSASVRVDGGKLSSLPMLGGVNCSLNGNVMPSTDNPITLSPAPNLASSWSPQPDQLSPGVKLSTSSYAEWSYTIPAAAKANFVGIIEMKVLDDGAVDKVVQMRLCRSDGAEQSSLIYYSVSGMSGKDDWMTVRFPIFQGDLIDVQVLRVSVTSNTGAVAELSIKDLAFYVSSVVLSDTAQSVISKFSAVPSRFKVKNIDYRSGYKEMLVIDLPSNINATTGDKARNVNPAAGFPKGWIYSAGAWVSEGNL